MLFAARGRNQNPKFTTDTAARAIKNCYHACASLHLGIFIHDLNSLTTAEEVLKLRNSLQYKLCTNKDPGKAKQKQQRANFKQNSGGENFCNMDSEILQYTVLFKKTNAR